MATWLMNKTRPIGNPYLVFEQGGWKWEVYKSYQKDDTKKYARYFCKVYSPIVPDGELGDVYVSDIPGALENA
jgi:hypothetical protein